MNNETAGRMLEMLMSEISEECYCAGWNMGLEYDLWKMLIGGNRGYGMMSISDQQVDDLIQLARECDGWHDGESVVPMKKWIEQYAKWHKGEHLQSLQNSVSYARSKQGQKDFFGRPFDQSDIDMAQSQLEFSLRMDPQTNPLDRVRKRKDGRRWRR